ncbi:MAG: adenylate/guanylate cyclase domain-containing protein [Alphaproteobacteria bacterium]
MRRLAAILAADVVGYSRLMGEDEAGTLAALRAHRAEIFDPVIAERGGRLVKLMGDGALVEFPSVVEAVEAALAIQQRVAAGSGCIRLRIGINLGDVIIDGDDIYGDGVNVAARLEALAEPGGICIASIVHESIGNRVEADFADAGEHEVKGIDRPIRVWRWPMEGAARPEPELLALPEKPSIATLPFDNMSSDPEQVFFAEGIAEDIITELSRFRSLFVIARNSSFSFKGQGLDVKSLSEKLGVRYIVEGSVRRAGNRVRITAQLIDAVTGAHLWAERYDRDLADIFAVQDEVTKAIVTAIEPTLGSAERTRARRQPPENLDAWESYQRGMWHAYRFTAVDNAEALPLFRRAIERDPNFAPGYAGLAYALYLVVMLGFGDDTASSAAEAYEAAQKAILLDPEDAFAQTTAGRIYLMMGEHEAAISAGEKALALSPNFASAHYGLGFALVYSGRPEASLAAVDEAIRLSPRDPMLWGFLTTKAQAFMTMGRYEEALEWSRKALLQPNAGVRSRVHEVIALAHLEHTEEARQALQRVYAVKSDFDMSFVRAMARMMRPSVAEPFIDGLRKAGLRD